MRDRTGQCLCSAVRFNAHNMEDSFSTCYCQMCQRWGGGPYRGVSVATEDLKIEGIDHITTLKTSAFAERAFCSKCGSGIWWRMYAGPYMGKTSIPVGLLDDRTGLVAGNITFSDLKDHTNEPPQGVEALDSAAVAKIITTIEDAL
ncbi:MAG: GFA family protein [Rhodobacteraceae bacterium]|nr:GFA family protein [Paracoccaceae bacterium]